MDWPDPEPFLLGIPEKPLWEGGEGSQLEGLMLLVRLEKEPSSLEVGRGERRGTRLNPAAVGCKEKIPTNLKTPTSFMCVFQ